MKVKDGKVVITRVCTAEEAKEIGRIADESPAISGPLFDYQKTLARLVVMEYIANQRGLSFWEKEVREGEE